MHWLAAHSPPGLVELVATERLSARSHGRWLWRRLRVRINDLEYRLAQEQIDGVTGRDLQARAREAIGELEEARAAVQVLETIGPYLSERRPHRTYL